MARLACCVIRGKSLNGLEGASKPFDGVLCSAAMSVGSMLYRQDGSEVADKAKPTGFSSGLVGLEKGRESHPALSAMSSC